MARVVEAFAHASSSNLMIDLDNPFVSMAQDQLKYRSMSPDSAQASAVLISRTHVVNVTIPGTYMIHKTSKAITHLRRSNTINW